VTIDTAISGMPTCVRQAWLVLGGNTIQLDNPSAGYMCQSLDLGTPIMRTVMNNRPDGDGIIDRTQYMGARTVVAAITALTSAGAQIDAVAASFAPFMVPSQRPVLHYVLDRPGAPERTLTLRPDSYDWPIVGAVQRDIALQWIAPNPISYSATQQSATSTPAPTATTATVTSAGDVAPKPVLTITGPVTSPFTFQLVTRTAGGTNITSYPVSFLAGFTLGAGSSVAIDFGARTAVMNTGASVLNQLNWTTFTWPVLPLSPQYTVGYWPGTPAGVTPATQAVFTWNDAYLV
jgi:hypothetical protein